MIAFLKLIRWPNLLIIVLTQYLMRYFVIKPMLDLSGIELILNHTHFFLLVFSTVLIAASGYIINDYFDTQIDSINRPGTVVVGTLIKRRVAIASHFMLSIIGIFLAFYVGLKAGEYKLGIIHFIASGLLWFYSTDFKRRPLIGNFIVGILAGMVPLIVPLFEVPSLNESYSSILVETGTNFNFLFYFPAGFGAFAFLLSLIREIIKDIEDYKGDEAFGLNTLPISSGIRKAKNLAIGLIFFTVILLGFLQFRQLKNDDTLSFSYILLVVQIPLLYLAYRVKQADTPEEYHAASSFTKLIMILGILYSALIFTILR